MREIFERMDQLQHDRPEMVRNPVWYPMKLQREEAPELLEVTYTNPTPEQKTEMLKEASDVMLLMVSLCLSTGVGYEEMEHAVLDKITEIGQRPSEHFARGIRS